MKYLIRWENNIISSITPFSKFGITYLSGDFLVTSNLPNAKKSLEALNIDCSLIDDEINNPSITE